MSEDVEKLLVGFKEFNRKAKVNPKMTEEELRTIFNKSKILETLRYEKVGKDIRIEKSVKGGKRSDIHCLDDYKNVIFVIEFKRPEVTNLGEHFDQLWDRYVKPLRANYGVLTNGENLLLYERVDGNSVKIIDSVISEIPQSDWEKIFSALNKKELEKTSISQVIKYFENFDGPDNRINLSTEEAQTHFFDSFELKEGSVFVDFLEKTYRLFDFEIKDSKFLSSAYSFWKTSYAKEPEKVPENWKKIMKGAGIETSRDNLFKFMFCLETSYSLFTRIILAKACEDYKLPGIDFSDFIKKEVRGSAFRGGEDIPLLSWPVLTFRLIKEMRQKLVKSVFEGDIFFWWSDSFEEFDKGEKSIWTTRQDREKIQFGSAIAEVILTLYKFDFSEIVGDPLGTLYQRYFDKETRKALGEFYTPKEVVDYILDAVGYKGKTIVGKRLLDPACGSGTFLVEALKRYLEGAREEAEERGWDHVLKNLCNEYHIVGFDIHPFATFMAQMQFMLVLIPKYKEAILQDRTFVLNRLPIFRTDSLAMEAKEERITQMTLQNGTKPLLVDTMLPIKEDENGENLKIEMPYKNDVLSKTDITNMPEYFAALQAVFDTVKDSAWRNVYDVDEERLKTSFKNYLSNKDWDKLVFFFKPYAVHLLESFKKLKDTFGDGRLIKSIEDVTLAALLKGYVDYDFVVGNPPYVRKEKLGDKTHYQETFPEVYHGDNDICVYFLHRGISWLNQSGRFGYIVSGKFTKTRYGKYIRAWIAQNSHIDQVIDLRGSKVFSGVTVDPIILTVEKPVESSSNINIVEVRGDPETGIEEEKLGIILDNVGMQVYEEYSDKLLSSFKIEQQPFVTEIQKENGKYFLDEWKLISTTKRGLFDKIKDKATILLQDAGEVYYTIKPGRVNILVVNEKKVEQLRLERAILKRVLRGEHIGRYHINYSEEYLVFPYLKNEGGIYKVVDLSKFENMEKYLKQFKGELESRSDIKSAVSKWYELRPCNYYEVFESPKIITPDISTKNTFTLEDKGLYCLDTCFIFSPKNEYKKQLKFILGLLNSNVLEYYIKQISAYLGKKGYRYKKQYLDPLPICLPQTKNEEKLASNITDLVTLILERVKLAQKIEKFPQEYIKEYRERGVEFDPIIITFNSDHKEIKITVEKSLEGDFNLILGKKERPITVDSETKVEYVKEVLECKRAKKNEKLQFLIPKDDSTVNEILDKLEGDDRAIKNPTVSELEEEINELVYKLYGLNENDKKVIEEFLGRF